MPIWLRNFTFNKIKEFHENKDPQNNTVQESIKNMRSVGAVNNKKIQVPTYVTKASKK